MIAQGYPLWLAEYHEGEVRAGRVVGWLIPAHAGRGQPAPLVAFTLPDGLLLETRPPRGPLVFLGECREEVVAAANRIAAGAPPAPDEPDEPGGGRPPDPRRRVNVQRVAADLDAEEPTGPGPRAHRSGHA